ncbi:SET and MYND domain-containing protein 4 [Melanaphis sacchari]|uniref:SET and MYND domain-containing protein 4 n=1 Tax=Melanaphis sacchari TaxID=742174 RepID=UPI000DC12D89|nr:SET and MYND domain-containing protein 4 [Melanaphis sacchari]
MNEPLTPGVEPFSIRHDRFRNILKSSDWDEFNELTDDKQKIQFVYERLYAHGQASSDSESTEDRPASYKNGDKALEMKKSGTDYFQKSDYRNALNWYSLAVLHCPQTDDWKIQLSIIYANRSACLYHLENYDLAISDIQRALDHGYPKDLRHKVYDRKARCFLATKQLKLALESFKATIQSLDDSRLSFDERRKRQLDVQIMLTMLGKDKHAKNRIIETGTTKSEEPEVDGGRSDAYPAFSNAVSVEYNEIEGRHAVAGRDVPIGKVLLVERAYASVLLRKYNHSHCTNCFVRLVAPLPCPDCERVAFCGEFCKRIALESYHAIECSMLPALFSAGVSITCLIALRIITQQPLKYFIDLRPKLLNHSLRPRDTHEPDNYVNLYDLVTHREKRSVQDILHRTHVAAFYLFCLKKTNYFPADCDTNRRLTDDELFIGSLLLHHLLLLQFNAFEVSELRQLGNEQQTVFIGGSVYPTLALLNHSCDPCVVRYHRGTTVVVHNIRELHAGETISENYGPMFMFHPKEERLQTLHNRYWFECNCIACCQDWPTLEQMKTNKSLRIRCTHCKNAITITTESMEFVVHCLVCSKTTKLLPVLKVLQDTENKYSVAKQLMDKHNYKKALAEFMALLSLLHKHMVPPFRDYHLCQQAIRQCMLTFGNKF